MVVMLPFGEIIGRVLGRYAPRVGMLSWEGMVDMEGMLKREGMVE